MPYEALVLEILVASPGDVQEEREIITELIHEWNDANSRDRRLVLLPIRWETHSSPELGAPPQTILNRQIVDQCDMAVGVFWTRLGTPTDTAESGTAEEISRVGDAGKPVMLYFSQSKVDLESIDLEEYKKLKDFKERSYPQGLVEHYSSPTEFREKFARQLAMTIRNLVAKDSKEAAHGESVVAQNLSIQLAAGKPPRVVAPEESIVLESVRCVNDADIPTYAKADQEGTREGELSALRLGSVLLSTNSNYYRELVEYYQRMRGLADLSLVITNTRTQGVHDLYLDLRVQSQTVTVQVPEPL